MADAFDKAYEAADKAEQTLKGPGASARTIDDIIAKGNALAQLASAHALIDIAETLRELKREGIAVNEL